MQIRYKISESHWFRKRSGRAHFLIKRCVIYFMSKLGILWNVWLLNPVVDPHPQGFWLEFVALRSQGVAEYQGHLFVNSYNKASFSWLGFEKTPIARGRHYIPWASIWILKQKAKKFKLVLWLQQQPFRQHRNKSQSFEGFPLNQFARRRLSYLNHVACCACHLGGSCEPVADEVGDGRVCKLTSTIYIYIYMS